MRHPNDMFHYVFKAEFVTLVSLKKSRVGVLNRSPCFEACQIMQQEVCLVGKKCHDMPFPKNA